MRRCLALRRLSDPRRRAARSRLVAVWPNGTENPIIYRAGAWWWKWDAGSYPQDAAIENVKAAGGRVERREVR